MNGIRRTVHIGPDGVREVTYRTAPGRNPGYLDGFVDWFRAYGLWAWCALFAMALIPTLTIVAMALDHAEDRSLYHARQYEAAASTLFGEARAMRADVARERAELAEAIHERGALKVEVGRLRAEVARLETANRLANGTIVSFYGSGTIDAADLAKFTDDDNVTVLGQIGNFTVVRQRR